MRKAVSLLGVVFAATVLLSACAAHYQPMGPPVQAPDLAEDAVIAADGYRLPLQVWRPRGTAQAVIVALHGFNDYSRAFNAAGRAWADSGLITYAYDQRGFGATVERGIWPGTETLVADARTVVQLVSARHQDLPVILLGESMGGAVAIALLGSPAPPPVAGAVLVAPALWGQADMGAVGRAGLWWARNVMPAMTVTGRGLNITPTDNRYLLRAMARDPLIIRATRLDALTGLVDLMDRAILETGNLAVPVLTLYGANEDLLPDDTISRLIDGIPETPHRVAVYASGYHMLLRDRNGPVVIRDIATWIGDPQGNLPSGADHNHAAGTMAER